MTHRPDDWHCRVKRFWLRHEAECNRDPRDGSLFKQRFSMGDLFQECGVWTLPPRDGLWVGYRRVD